MCTTEEYEKVVIGEILNSHGHKTGQVSEYFSREN